MTLTFDDLVAEGLYDPDAADADIKRQLLERALAVGAGLGEIRQACEGGWLHVVPTRVAILGGAPTLSVEEAGERAGLAPDLAARLWHTLRLDQRGYRMCVEEDVAIFELYAGVLSMFGEEEMLQIAAVQAAA